jgi:hypothetical protein
MDFEVAIIALVLESKIALEKDNLSYVARGVIVRDENIPAANLLYESRKFWNNLVLHDKKSFSFTADINKNGNLEVVVGYFRS